MYAIRQYELGGPEVLLHEEVPDLAPGEGQVRIAVEASGPQMLARAADGSRVPVVGSTFLLSAAADAHRAIEDRATHGKVVLIPGGRL